MKACPAKLLLDSVELRLGLGGDSDHGNVVDEGCIDDATSRCRDPDLEAYRPSRGQTWDEALDHRRLEPVDEAGTRAREVSDAQVCAESDAHRHEHIETGRCDAGLDPSEVRAMDADDGTELGERQTGVQAETADIVARAPGVGASFDRSRAGRVFA
jgi:hypothetical protein